MAKSKRVYSGVVEGFMGLHLEVLSTRVDVLGDPEKGEGFVVPEIPRNALNNPDGSGWIGHGIMGFEYTEDASGGTQIPAVLNFLTDGEPA